MTSGSGTSSNVASTTWARTSSPTGVGRPGYALGQAKDEVDPVNGLGQVDEFGEKGHQLAPRSVWAKSSPLKSNGSPVALARE